jgi:Ca2+-binding EF-hand superfamily protein
MGNSSSSNSQQKKAKGKRTNNNAKKYEVKPAAHKAVQVEGQESLQLVKPGLTVSVSGDLLDKVDNRLIQPVKVNRSKHSLSPSPSPGAGNFHSLPNQASSTTASSLLPPNLRHSLVSPSGSHRSSSVRSASPAPRYVSTLFSPQAHQFPPPSFHAETSCWSSFLDNYHTNLLLNANNGTIQEIFSHYDTDGDRVLSKSELRAFAKDLVQRVLRDFAENYYLSHPKSSLKLLKSKVEDEKIYLLPIQKNSTKNEEECIKVMIQVIRSLADKNGDGKVSNQEMMLVFTVLMKKLFNEQTKKKSNPTDTGIACNIQ